MPDSPLASSTGALTPGRLLDKGLESVQYQRCLPGGRPQNNHPMCSIIGIGGQTGIGIAPVHGDIFIRCQAGYPYPNLGFPSGVPVGDFVL